jgi:hypothetical protein
MKTVCLYLSLLALTAAGCATGKGESYMAVGYDFTKLEKVAVLEVTGAVYGDAVKNQIGDFFAMEMLKRGFTVVERGQVQALLKEQKFEISGVTSDKDVAKAGQILNVPAVMLINIPDYKEEKMSMTAKIVNVEDATVLWLGSGSGSTGKTLSTILGAAAGAAAGAVIAGGDRGDRTIGGIAGGVLGCGPSHDPAAGRAGPENHKEGL